MKPTLVLLIALALCGCGAVAVTHTGEYTGHCPSDREVAMDATPPLRSLFLDLADRATASVMGPPTGDASYEEEVTIIQSGVTDRRGQFREGEMVCGKRKLVKSWE